MATNKPQRFADSLLREFDLIHYFRYVCGADESGILSKSGLIAICMNEMCAKQNNTVLIGDTDNDALGAFEAGIRFLAVTYGFGFKTSDDLKDVPNMGIAESPEEIVEIVLKNTNLHGGAVNS